jgi:membrane protein DedA with SNARE-associated domain
VYLVIGLLAAVENVFPPVPADTAVAIGAFLSTGGHISAWAVFGVTWFANTVSATAVYVAGRTVGRAFFRGRIGRRLLHPRSMHRLELVYQRHGRWGIVLTRFVPGLRAVVPPFAGIAGLGAGSTLIPLVLASGLWYGALTFLAVTLIGEFDEIARFARGLNIAGVVAAGMLVAIVVAVVWRRRRLRRGAVDDAGR